ncbi:UNKNOWN [Stylonychia lemnae]|uniref:Uncharacterized protein n=1 Tax=Stylonychia lemnae TaxID=5949 RepID=A0A078B023_STYLE|nr:UNKNOWN [Stylonychia lemnae]|eukprot:CDW87854.1 UNKNOWN [Stylonychia lemnae]
MQNLPEFVRSNYQWSLRDLFGGALFIKLPLEFADIRYILQKTNNPTYSSHVPVSDNQEVFSNVNNDAQLIIELLEYHEGTEAFILKGTQKIIPNKKVNDTRDFVSIIMLLIRLKQFKTDLLITLNIPDKTLNQEGVAQGDGSSEAFTQNVAINEAMFQEAMNQIYFTDMETLENLFNTEMEMEMN